MSGAGVETRLTCEDLMIQSYRLVDEGHASQVTELFTQDGQFMIEGAIDASGSDALARLFAAREADKARRTRHCLSNFSFIQVSDDEARGRATLMVFVLGEGGAPNALADVEDCYRTEGGHWRIAARTTTPL